MAKDTEPNDAAEGEERRRGATSRPRPQRVKKQELTELERMLALVASDSEDVDTVPNVSALSAVEAAERLAAYYSKRAKDISENDLGRKERTRGLIVIGALAMRLSEKARAEFLALFLTLEPRDVACVRSIEWARLLLDSQKKGGVSSASLADSSVQ